MCQRLRDARERSGLKQMEAAAAIGKPQNFVSKCETGQRRIDPVELADFAALYGTTLDALVPAPAAGLGERARRVAERTIKPKKEKKRRGRSRRRPPEQPDS
ncbi:MAG: helix-turn-helix domain-containing protein [Gemmatimonadales bacterium]